MCIYIYIYIYAPGRRSGRRWRRGALAEGVSPISDFRVQAIDSDFGILRCPLSIDVTRRPRLRPLDPDEDDDTDAPGEPGHPRRRMVG